MQQVKLTVEFSSLARPALNRSAWILKSGWAC